MKKKIKLIVTVVFFIVINSIYGDYNTTNLNTKTKEFLKYKEILKLDTLRKIKMVQNGYTDKQSFILPETKNLIKNIRSFQRKHRKSSLISELLFILGNLYYSAQMYDKAILEFEKISTKSYPGPYKVKSFIMLGNSYSALERYDDALKSYRRILDIKSLTRDEYTLTIDRAAGALFKKASSLKKKNDYKEAADIYKSIYDEFPNCRITDRAWFEAGLCYQKLDSLEKAALTFKDLLITFPQSGLNAKTATLSGEIYEKLGRYDDALQVYIIGLTNLSNSSGLLNIFNEKIEECKKHINTNYKIGNVIGLQSRHQIDTTIPPLSLLDSVISIDLLILPPMLYRNTYLSFPKKELIHNGLSNIGKDITKEIVSVLKNEGFYACCDCKYPPIKTPNLPSSRYEIYRVYTHRGDTLDIKRKLYSNSFCVIYRLENDLTIFNKSFNPFSQASLILDSLSNLLLPIIEDTTIDSYTSQKSALQSHFEREWLSKPNFSRRGCVKVENGLHGIKIIKNNNIHRLIFYHPIFQARPLIRRLYNKFIFEKGKFDETLSFRLLIDNKGNVIKCSNISNQISDKSFDEEIRKILTRIKFDINKSPTDTFEIHVPLVFQCN